MSFLRVSVRRLISHQREELPCWFPVYLLHFLTGITRVVDGFLVADFPKLLTQKAQTGTKKKCFVFSLCGFLNDCVSSWFSVI